MTKIIITQELVKELFYYDNGFLYWKAKGKRRKLNEVAGCYAPIRKRDSGRRWILHFNGKTYLASRLIFLYHHGWLPEVVDHEDRNCENDKIENLRPATYSQNTANSIRTKENKTSKYKGVHLDRDKKWVAMIYINKKTKYIGVFTTEQNAALAYNREAVKVHKEYAYLNIIQP